MDIEQLIAARPTERRHLGAWYADLLDTAEREGLTMPSLAKRLGVVAETLYAWRRKRRGYLRAEAPRRVEAGLVRVRIAEPTAAIPDDRPLEHVLRGWLLSLEANIPTAMVLVARVIRMIADDFSVPNQERRQARSGKIRNRTVCSRFLVEPTV